MNRREAMLMTAAAPLWWPVIKHSSSRLSMEAYIWNQYARRRRKPLSSVLADVIPMARKAGFQNVEFNQSFFAPALRVQVLKLVETNGLALPSVYVGGPMHERSLAMKTISQSLEIAALLKDYGCRAIVNNPDPKPGDIPKSDAELAVQVEMLNRLGEELAERGFELWVHAHAPAMADNAREWRYNLQHTDPKLVWICFDVDWVYQGGQNPLALLREADRHVASLHLRNSRHKTWLESFSDGDIDYRQIEACLEREKLRPLLVVELAYMPNTVITRPLEENLRLSRLYAERVFNIRG